MGSTSQMARLDAGSPAGAVSVETARRGAVKGTAWKSADPSTTSILMVGRKVLERLMFTIWPDDRCANGAGFVAETEVNGLGALREEA